jgi:hypothetical protein
VGKEQPGEREALRFTKELKVHKCLASCGKTITYRFAICADCEKIYGNRSRSWPPWLRYLWIEEQRERRRKKRTEEHEVEFSDFFLEEETNEPDQ